MLRVLDQVTRLDGSILWRARERNLAIRLRIELGCPKCAGTMECPAVT